ncbi:MAG TPA: hypothetical protein V6D22_14970 [Candidatus Obscuribacterales bacterium]
MRQERAGDFARKFGQIVRGTCRFTGACIGAGLAGASAASAATYSAYSVYPSYYSAMPSPSAYSYPVQSFTPAPAPLPVYGRTPLFSTGSINTWGPGLQLHSYSVNAVGNSSSIYQWY